MYNSLNKELENRILEDRKSNISYGFNESNYHRRDNSTHDNSTLIRSAFIRDIDKILYCPYYSRYEDKTQVYSLNKNDDISHRSLHVQLVSRIARTIGKALNLNLELIEAIAIGHDIGHTPFGHLGETYLNNIYHSKTGRYFYHNVQSFRVLNNIFPYNITLETLDGILSHNGEQELDKYIPVPITSYEELDTKVEKCYIDKQFANSILPSTLEGCVVRISDIIAYVGKDRQDAKIAKNTDNFEYNVIGNFSAEIINNLTVNIIENSYGKDYIKLDPLFFNELKKIKKDNYTNIYNSSLDTESRLNIKTMFELMYDKLLDDLYKENKESYIFTHHIDYINKIYYKRATPYINTEPNQIVVDYIASMTDSYFIELFNKLFPNQSKIKEKGYFI